MPETLEKYDESNRKELPTKGDIQDVRNELVNTRHEILKWMMAAMGALHMSLTALGLAF